VFVALRDTVRRHGLPKAPFQDLISAFVQDQKVNRYATWEELFGYCRCSANPVGRLVLGLCGYADEERYRLSDVTCTALQLANFWQDVSVDLGKDRVYIPDEVMARHGYTAADLFSGREDDAFRAVMRELVERTRHLFHEGLPLARTVDRRLAIDLDLFSRGGILVLDKIRQANYNVLRARPAIGKLERVGLLLSSVARHLFRSAA
jgi:squalene synthase HpnC